MRFSTTQPMLARAAQEAARVANSKRLPALASLLIRATEGEGDEPGQVTITGSDLNTRITSTITASVEESGVALVPAAELVAYVNKLSNDGAIFIESENDKTPKFTIKWGKRNQAVINCLDANEFPEVRAIEFLASFPAMAFAEIIGRVAICAATTNARPMLVGVGFSSRQGGGLVVSATDGFMAGIEEIPDAPEFPPAIIPATLLLEVARVIKSRVKQESVEVVRVGMTENSVSFQVGSVEVAGQIMEGNFPPVRQIIRPQDRDTGNVAVDVSALRQALARALALMGDVVTAHLVPSEHGWEVTSQSATGSPTETLEAVITGDIPGIGVNPRLLDNLLAGLPPGVVNIGLSTPAAPIILRHPAAPNYQAALMLMHLEAKK